ncbi:transglycosylase domain-containing protein [Lottiidibacillus patelloidae]|nr:PBP1A family penicillin-binding protein [Lottiidibacillus patelloidae]
MSKNAQRKTRRAKQKKSLFKRILLGSSLLGSAIFLILTIIVISYILDAPSLEKELLNDAQSSIIYDMNGQEVEALSGVENRKTVSISDVPELMQNAFIAVEDIRFKEHIGIDIKRIFGAVVANVTRGIGSEGASTITQQVIKNSFFSHEKKFKRKIQEQYLAILLERNYSKDEILAMYLNKIYFSEGAYGVATAAKTYFGKELNELELHEIALLAGMPQRPNYYNPFINPEEAEKRRNIVLSQMEKYGFITAEEANEAKEKSVTDSLIMETEEKKQYHQFMRQVINEIDAYAKKHQVALNLYEGGLKIYTTIDIKAQQHVESLMENGTITYPDENFQAAVVLLDSKTGAIRALTSGRNNTTIDFANIQRQPGSTIKPILDYGPAIEYLQWSTGTLINDEEYFYSTGKKVNNWDKKYRGNVTVREALSLSLNVPAVKAFKEVGAERAKTFATSIGMPANDKYLESYAIGGFTVGPTPIDIAGAYRSFADRGYYSSPYSVEKIEFPDGRVINLKPEEKKVMSEATAYMITDMLKTVVKSGTGSRGNVQGLPLAGKTGTTNLPDEWNEPLGARDSWFAGYTTNYTAAVWTGYNSTTKEQHISNEGKRIAAYLFKAVMENVHADKETANFTKPANVLEVYIEKSTGLLPSDYTPKEEIISELYIKGTEPREISKKYKQVEQPMMDGIYDKENDKIILNWNHETNETEEETNEVVFDLHVSIDEGPYQLILENTTALTYELTEPIDGAIYRYRLIAKDRNYPSNVSIPFVIEILVEKPLFQLPDPFDNNGNDGEEEGRQEDDETTDDETDEGSDETGTSLLNINL